MSKQISYIDCERILNAAHSLTGNNDFLKIIERLQSDKKIIEIAKKVAEPFPVQADDSYYTHQRLSLTDKLKQKHQHTSEFVVLLNKWEMF